MIEGKICLVTGATSGIGKEIALGLASLGGSITIIGRNKSKCEGAMAEISERLGKDDLPISYILADLASQQSIRNAVKEFEGRQSHLNILVNNAGIFRARREATVDGIECTFAVNHLAPFLLTNLLMERLKEGRARVVTTSSIAHRSARIKLDDLQFKRSRYSGIRAYGQSKLANILFTKELARRLEGTGIIANCFHPGGVRTDLAQDNPWYYRLLWQIISPFMLSPAKGADTGIYLATSPDLDSTSGKYFVKRKELAPSQEAGDMDMAARLWDLSAQLTGL